MDLTSGPWLANNQQDGHELVSFWLSVSHKPAKHEYMMFNFIALMHLLLGIRIDGDCPLRVQMIFPASRCCHDVHAPTDTMLPPAVRPSMLSAASLLLRRSSFIRSRRATPCRSIYLVGLGSLTKSMA